MPKRISSREVRVGKLERATYICPHCSQRCTYATELVDRVNGWNQIQCRNCRKFFRPPIIGEQGKFCFICRARVPRYEYRYTQDYAFTFCPGCAEIFDKFEQEIEDRKEAWVAALPLYLQKKHRQLRQGGIMSHIKKLPAKPKRTA